MVKKNKINKTSRNPFRLIRGRFTKEAVFIMLFVVFGLVVIFVKATSPVDTNFITGVADLGTLSQPANFTGRDGGQSALVGGKVTWIFGDTLYAPRAPSFTGDLFRSATAAIATTSTPTQVSEPLNSQLAPNQLIPYSAPELAYNIAHRSGGDRYALWPSSIATKSDGNTAWVFFNDLLISGGQWTTQGTGIATVAAGSTVAARQPNMLFSAGEPPFRKSLTVGNQLYLYEGATGQAFCKVSRAPLDQAGTRNAYRFWNGSSWVADVGQAARVVPCSNQGFSVMYNQALKSYVEAIIPNFSKAVYFSYAAAPEGPWSAPIKGFDLPHDSKDTWLYVPSFHPELSTDGDRSVYLSYSGNGSTVRLMKINLQPPANGQPASSLAAASYGSALAPASSKPAAPAAASSSSPANSAASAPATPSSQAAPVLSATTKTTARKLTWWQRFNLYLRRHWSALMQYLSS